GTNGDVWTKKGVCHNSVNGEATRSNSEFVLDTSGKGIRSSLAASFGWQTKSFYFGTELVINQSRNFRRSTHNDSNSGSNTADGSERQQARLAAILTAL